MSGVEQDWIDLSEPCSTGLPEPVNGQLDEGKIASLAEDMIERGWQGPPIVVNGDLAATGSHRLAAIRRVWNAGVELEFPVLPIAEVARVHGLDWDSLCEQRAEWYEALLDLIDQLPQRTVDHLGLDAH